MYRLKGILVRRTAFVILAGAVAAGFLTPALSVKPATPPRVLRLHVIAASDRPGDQAVKLAVRDAVLLTLDPALRKAGSESAAWRIVQGLLPVLKSRAEAVVARFGLREPVRVRLTYDVFPVKSYGNLVLPAGRYPALEVLLGRAAGQNWWCVLFPPLCLVDPDTAISVSEPASAPMSPHVEKGDWLRRLEQELSRLW